MRKLLEYIRGQSNVERALSITAVGCGVYLLKELYSWWRKRETELKTARKENDSYMRHPAYNGYPDLSIHNNIMARYLTPEVYETLKDKKTSGGFTLSKVIQIGVDCPGMPWERASGVIAGDEESYQIFALLFDKIIKDLHQYSPEDSHRKNMESNSIIKGNFDGKRVKSIRIKAHRSLGGYRLPAGCCEYRVPGFKYFAAIISIYESIAQCIWFSNSLDYIIKKVRQVAIDLFQKICTELISSSSKFLESNRIPYFIEMVDMHAAVCRRVFSVS